MKNILLLLFLLHSAHNWKFRIKLHRVFQDLTHQLDQHVARPVSHFFTKDAKKGIQKINSNLKKFVEDLKKLGPEFQKLFEKFRSLSQSIHDKSNLEHLQAKQNQINKQIEIIEKQISPIQGYTQMLTSLKTKNQTLSGMVKRLSQQVKIDQLQKRKIDDNISTYLQNLQALQSRELVSEALLQQLKTKIKELSQK